MREVFMSKQGVLSYRMECERTSQNLTGLSGLGPFVELAVASGLMESIGRNVSVCGEQGWTDQEIVMSVLLLNLAGGDCVDDLDHAGYEHVLLAWLDRMDNKGRLGRIEFTVSCDVTPEFRTAVLEVRYIATREALVDQVLPGMESEQLSLPFQTITSGGITYKLFGVVTNLTWDGADLIRFHDGRCGKCEEAHKVLKEDFAVLCLVECGRNGG
jgi:hypothetical protein